MSCCDETTARVPPTDLSRRTLLKGAAVIASALPGAAKAQGRSIKLAYCSQLLCGVPYEVARSAGHFKKHGLNVELVYTRGGSAAMQALVGNAVDYAATSLDVAITAFAKGAAIKRFAVTGRLPLFALVTAPKTAAQIKGIGDLQGRTVAVSGLGNADHALTLYLLAQAKADAGKVKFATMGVNLLEALRQGQIDAGLVQEPALTLLQRSGARVLVNAMDLTDARRYLGGTYEFMGVAVRTKEMEQRKDEMLDADAGARRRAQGAARHERQRADRGAAQGNGHRPRHQGIRRDHRALPRLALSGGGDHRSRGRRPRRPDADRRRAAPAGTNISGLHDTSIVKS